MPRLRALVAIVVAAIALAPARSSAAPGFPSHAARVEIAVTSASAASVTEVYELDAPIDGASFEFLQQPCSEVGTVAILSGERSLTVQPARNGPWTILRAAGSVRDSIRLKYDVRLGDGGMIPIVLPASTMASVPQTRGAEISVAVSFDPALEHASVVLPRLERDGTGGWHTRMLAVPSVVGVRVPRESTGCARALAGTTGGLEYRFWIFVGTMAIWIPVYFWWFSRRDATA